MRYDRRAFVKTAVAATAAIASRAPLNAQASPFFPGFTTQKIRTSGAIINTLRGGSGPPLLLIHGAPQTHVEWHKIAPRLAQRFTVVMTDLRGYGDSSRPPDGDNHVNYSKRAMALDQVEVMRSFGFERFAVVGHDRGARVTWRLAVEHPDVVTKAAVLDIVPEPYSRVTREYASDYFHLFFLVQPAPLPETLIGNSGEYWFRSRFVRQNAASGVFTPEAVAEYVRPFRDPAAIHAYCEDYRAGATIDLAHVAEDGPRKVVCPLLVLWGDRSTVGRLEPVMDAWREKAANVTGKALPAGHYLPEEVPEETLSALMAFLP